MSSQPQAPRSPWSRPGFIGAAGVLALVGIAAIAVVVLPSGHKTPAPAAAPAAGETATGSDSVCGLPAGSQAVPATGPAARWELVGRIAAPSAPGIGPGKVCTGQRSCYAHSPTGALYAAVNALAVVQNPATFAWGAENLLAAGPGRTKAIADARSMTAFPAGTQQMQGFHFVSSGADSVVLDVAFRQSITGTPDVLGHNILTLRWEGGDWKLVTDATGNPYYGKANIADLTGYTPWSGI